MIGGSVLEGAGRPCVQKCPSFWIDVWEVSFCVRCVAEKIEKRGFLVGKDGTDLVREKDAERFNVVGSGEWFVLHI